MGEIVCFLLTNKRNVRFFPLSSCWPILFYLILRVKRNMSISVGVVGNTTMNSPFFSIFPADVLLTVALIQRRNIIVLAAVRRRVAIDFRPLSAIFDSHRRRLPRPSLAKISYVRKIYRYTSSDILLSLLPSIEISGRAGVQQRRPFSLSNALRHRLPAPLLFPKSYYAASRWRVSTNPFMRFLLISGTVLPFAFLDPRLSIASISN